METSCEWPLHYLSKCPKRGLCKTGCRACGGVVAFAAEQDAGGLRREAAAANETWLAYPDDDPCAHGHTQALTPAQPWRLFWHTRWVSQSATMLM